MNFWTGLILGLILGWVIEWVIDWLFWRRPAAEDSGLQAELRTAQTEASRLQNELRLAEQDTVNWRAKFDEQAADCAAQVQELEVANAALRADLDARGELTADMPSMDMSLETPLAGAAAAATIVTGRVGAFGDVEEPDIDVDMPGVDLLDVDIDRPEMGSLDMDMPSIDTDMPDVDFDPTATVVSGRVGSFGDVEEPDIDVDMPDVDLLDVDIDRPEMGSLDMDMPSIDTDMPDVDFDPTATVVSGRVGSFGDVEEPDIDVDMPGVDMLDVDIDQPEMGGLDVDMSHIDADMPPVEVEPLEALPAVTSFFLDDLPEGAVVVRCPQDLSAVRGIGQLYEQRLYRAGVGTYWMLAELSDEMLNDILEVQAFQDVDLDAIRASAREWMEKTNSSGRVWDATEPDDFEVLEGIGDVYEGRLYDAGICTYASLAALTEAELAEICRAPSFRTPDYAGWIATAQRLSAQAEG